MTKIPTFKLNDGTEIPSFGFGVFQIPADGSTYKAVLEALKIGYRSMKQKLVKQSGIVVFHVMKFG